MTRRAFTVHEANALLTTLDATLARIEGLKGEVREAYGKLQVLDLLWGERVLEPSNPDHAEAHCHRDAIATRIRRIEEMIQQEILDVGLRFPPGGLDRGLVDFPTTWEGRWVYLCWQRGEPTVQAWHEVTGGFAGRRPITPEQVERMGLEAAVDDPMLDY